MDISHIPLFAALTRRMAWLSERQTVLAENVANANTPGYVAKDLKEPSFRDLIDGPPQTGVRLAADQPGDIAVAPPSGGAAIIETPDDRSLDGNGVSIEAQMMKVSTNEADYALAAALYQQNIGLIKMVLGGGGSSGGG